MTARPIRLEDDIHLTFPATRWSLSHLRELVPTRAVWRGSGPIRPFASRAKPLDDDLDALEFDDLSGCRRTWIESLGDTYTDGIVVLYRGAPVYERYFGELLPHRPHACFSITKSYVATLAAVLIHDGLLDEAKTVLHYLPEMNGTAFADATLRHVLDMQVGIDYSENYADSDSPFWHYTRAAGLRSQSAGYTGPRSGREFLVALRKRGQHGAAFDYATVNTEVLCWILARASGAPLADLLSERLWSQLGCAEDGYLTLDSTGVEMGGAGLSATLRDVARFGELLRCNGAVSSQQVIPAEVVADIRRGADREKFSKAGYTLLPHYSYRNMWWVSHDAQGVFEARGIFGQRLYVAPQAEVVIARFCSHPVAASSANDPITLPAFRTLCHYLMRAG